MGRTMVTAAGTPAYMAPELLQERPFNKSVDVYAFGILLSEVSYHRLPLFLKKQRMTLNCDGGVLKFDRVVCIAREIGHELAGPRPGFFAAHKYYV